MSLSQLPVNTSLYNLGSTWKYEGESTSTVEGFCICLPPPIQGHTLNVILIPWSRIEMFIAERFFGEYIVPKLRVFTLPSHAIQCILIVILLMQATLSHMSARKAMSNSSTKAFILFLMCFFISNFDAPQTLSTFALDLGVKSTHFLMRFTKPGGVPACKISSLPHTIVLCSIHYTCFEMFPRLDTPTHTAHTSCPWIRSSTPPYLALFLPNYSNMPLEPQQHPRVLIKFRNGPHSTHALKTRP